MAITELLDLAQDAGLHFILDGDRVGVRGDPVVVNEWAPRLRRNKTGVLAEIRKRNAGMHRVWVIRPPRREAFAVTCPQGATADEVLLVWPGSIVQAQK